MSISLVTSVFMMSYFLIPKKFNIQRAYGELISATQGDSLSLQKIEELAFSALGDKYPPKLIMSLIKEMIYNAGSNLDNLSSVYYDFKPFGVYQSLFVFSVLTFDIATIQYHKNKESGFLLDLSCTSIEIARELSIVSAIFGSDSIPLSYPNLHGEYSPGSKLGFHYITGLVSAKICPNHQGVLGILSDEISNFITPYKPDLYSFMHSIDKIVELYTNTCNNLQSRVYEYLSNTGQNLMDYWYE